MSRLKKRIKITYNKHYKILILVFLIVANTFAFYVFFSNRLSNTMMKTSMISLNNILTNLLNNKITIDDLKKSNINNIITLQYNNKKEIIGVDYNLEAAYDLMLNIKETLYYDVDKIKADEVIYRYKVVNGNVIIDIPFYAFTNNMLLANLGPKVKTKVNLFNNIVGKIETSIRSYGVNTALIELYVEFKINSVIIIPFENNQITNDYKILIASKVVQGGIPSLYNGLLKNGSSDINLVN